jgi:hypothetical protein
MPEHVYEFPMDDFEPSKACMQHAITGGTCCPSGTHRHDCEIVQGFNKQRLSHEPKEPSIWLFPLLVIVFSTVGYAVLSTIN